MQRSDFSSAQSRKKERKKKTDQKLVPPNFGTLRELVQADLSGL
jgi:hypothetical protein